MNELCHTKHIMIVKKVSTFVIVPHQWAYIVCLQLVHALEVASFREVGSIVNATVWIVLCNASQ